MKTKWIVLLLLNSLCFVGCDKDSDVDWNTEHRLELAVRVHKLEDAVQQIQAERNVLSDNKESTTFVSVAALRATGYETQLLRKTPCVDEFIWSDFVGRISIDQFTEWVAKAREWEEKHGKIYIQEITIP